MLGHKSATMTLDLYGHLFPDQLDQLADALDAAHDDQASGEHRNRLQHPKYGGV